MFIKLSYDLFISHEFKRDEITFIVPIVLFDQHKLFEVCEIVCI